MYALKEKSKFLFWCHSTDEKELDARVGRAFYSWLGMQPYGSNKTMDDFMADKEKVKITIERI